MNGADMMNDTYGAEGVMVGNSDDDEQLRDAPGAAAGAAASAPTASTDPAAGFTAMPTLTDLVAMIARQKRGIAEYAKDADGHPDEWRRKH